MSEVYLGSPAKPFLQLIDVTIFHIHIKDKLLTNQVRLTETREDSRKLLNNQIRGIVRGVQNWTHSSFNIEEDAQKVTSTKIEIIGDSHTRSE